MPSSDREDWYDRFRGRIGEHHRERVAESGTPWRLDRYEILERLGEGGAAVVCRARDRELGRMVALKMLRETLGVSDAARERFRREAKVAALVSHPNVVRVYDAGETAGRLYIVMELVEGRPLGDVLSQRTHDVREMARLLERVSRGVAAAQAQGIIHRDLKPGNILVGRDGEPKVGDFGLAHIAGGEVGLTRTGAVMGTPLYMAPEQVRGKTGEISSRTDVYALGAILYEILTGRPPHIGESVTEIYGKIVGEEPAPPRKLNAGVAGDLATIALKALEKEPARRYASAEEFAEDLRRYLDGESILAKPPGTILRAVKWTKRHRAASAVLGTAVLAVVLVPTIVAAQRRHAVAGFLESGRGALADFRRLQDELGPLRKEATEPESEIGLERNPSWAIRRKIRDGEAQVALRRADAIEAFTRAQGVEFDNLEARSALAGLYFEEFERAERERDWRAMAESERRVRMCDDGTYAPRLVQEGSIELDSIPSGAAVELQKYEEGEGPRLVPVPVKNLGVCPIPKASLPRGSYLLILRKTGYRDVRYPVLVGRGTVHVGKVNLYTDEEIGADFVLVPGGPFLLGGDAWARLSEDGRVSETGDFFIARTETTRRDYVAYLNGIASERGRAEARKRLPRDPKGKPLADLPEDGALTIHPALAAYPTAWISWEDAEDYCRWLTSKGGAVYRLPRNDEWEKAAKGVDGRNFPWGNEFDMSFLSDSPGKEPPPQPPPVGSMAKDASPYGVLDMAGSLCECCSDGPGSPNLRYVRGGFWNMVAEDVFRSSSRARIGIQAVSPGMGFRVVKEPPRR